jgi:excisionase family DNA binding protein
MSTAQVQEPRLLDAAEVADRLGISVHTVRNMTDRGELPVVNVGPRLKRYQLEAVLRALNGDVETRRRRAAARS